MSKKKDRRKFILSSGGVMVLPLFEQMLSTKAFANSSEAPLRFLSMFVPNGSFSAPEHFYPSMGSGKIDVLGTQILAPFNELRGDINLIRGLSNHEPAGWTPQDGGGDHARAAASYMSCVRILKGGLKNAKSVDQIIADHIEAQGVTSHLKSVHVCPTEVTFADIGYDENYPNISWKNDTTPNTLVSDPGTIFSLLFPTTAPTDSEVSAAKETYRLKMKKSRLDAFAKELATIKQKLTKLDQERLEQYATSLREIERSLDASLLSLNGDGPQCSVLDLPAYDKNQPKYDLNFTERMDMHTAMMINAMQCDLSRVFTMQLSSGDYSKFRDELGAFNLPSNLAGLGWHTVSHWNSDTSWRPKYDAICQYVYSQAAQFIKNLKEAKDANGESLLTSMVGSIGSGLCSGHTHVHKDLPMITFGKANGKHTTGNYKYFTSERKLADFWLRQMAVFGITGTSLGNSESPIVI